MIKTTQALAVFLFFVCTMMISTAMAAGAVDGAPSFNAGQQPGIYVWRESNGNWQIRVTSGGKWQNAKGGFSSSKPFQWVSSVALEGNDSLTKRNKHVADFDFKTSTSDYLDGIVFSVPTGGTMCFWGGGTLGGNIFLGPNANRVSPPVDLLGNGGCSGGGSGSSSGGSSTDDSSNSTPSYSGSLKYNPGHYIATNDIDWNRQGFMVEAASKPGVKGVLVRYLWRDLEPQQGKYDFSKIESDLRLLADHGMQLIARIEDKSFKSHAKPTPQYMWANHTLWHNHFNGGYIAKRWDPWVTQRMGALTKAMGARFDNHKNFEGITFEETSLGLSDAILRGNGYTAEKYRDETIKMLKNARAHFPKSQVFWSMNFFPWNQSYIGQIANAVAPLKIAMGGPDILPDDRPLNEHTYPYYRQFKDRMTLFSSMQYNSYSHRRKDGRTKYWTMPAMFQFARDQLHVNYIFWTQKLDPAPWDSYDWKDALPTIRNNPTFNR